MIQVDDNTKQTQLYKNYIELVEFLHNEKLSWLMDNCICEDDELYFKYDDLLSKNLL